MKVKIPWKGWATDAWMATIKGKPKVYLEVFSGMPYRESRCSITLNFWAPTAKQASRAALNFLKRIGWQPEVEK